MFPLIHGQHLDVMMIKVCSIRYTNRFGTTQMFSSQSIEVNLRCPISNNILITHEKQRGKIKPRSRAFFLFISFVCPCNSFDSNTHRLENKILTK